MEPKALFKCYGGFPRRKYINKLYLKNYMQEITTILKGCPICKGDVVGNDQALFFCKKCNLLFAQHSLNNEQT